MNSPPSHFIRDSRNAELFRKLSRRHVAKEEVAVGAQGVGGEEKRLAQLLSRKLSGYVFAGEKTRDRYGLAEKVVADAVNIHAEMPVSRLCLASKRAYRVIGGIPGRNGYHTLRRALREPVR